MSVMAKSFMATRDDKFGQGASLLEAWECLKEEYEDAYDITECEFFEIEKLEVEVKVVKKEVVSKITKKPCGD
jgi:hypothetical protein